MGSIAPPTIYNCEDFLLGYSAGYAEVVESMECGQTHSAEVFMNELDEASYNYRAGFTRGVHEAVSDSKA